MQGHIWSYMYNNVFFPFFFSYFFCKFVFIPQIYEPDHKPVLSRWLVRQARQATTTLDLLGRVKVSKDKLINQFEGELQLADTGKKGLQSFITIKIEIEEVEEK